MNAEETVPRRVESSAGVDADLLGLLVLDCAPGWERLVRCRVRPPSDRVQGNGAVPQVTRLTRIRELPALVKSFAHMTLLLSAPPSPLLAGRSRCARFEALDVLPAPLPLANAWVVAMHPYAPLLCGAVSTALVSHRDRAQMGIALDTGAVIEPDLSMRCVRESFDEVIGLPSPSAPARAGPAVWQGAQCRRTANTSRR